MAVGQIAPETYVSDLAFSPDGNTLAVTSKYNGVYLWNIHQSQTPLVMIGGDFDTVTFSPDGKFFAAGGRDSGGEGCECAISSVHLYTASTYEQSALLQGYATQESYGVTDLAFSPDSTQIITLDYSILVWEVAKALQAGTLNIRQGTVIAEPNAERFFFKSISLSPDGSLLAFSNSKNSFSQTLDSSIRTENEITLWDTRKQTVEQVLRVETNDSPIIKFNHDGLLLASASADIISYQEKVGYTYSNANPIQLWDVETGQQKVVLKQDSPVSSLAFSPDGALLATGDFEGHVHIWDVSSGEQVRILEANNRMIASLEFSPDGKLLVSGSEKTIRLWGVPTG